jgi:hypothetical protein
MAKLIKTKPEDLLNLQSGDFAHFVSDGIAVNDVKTFEPRHRINNIHKTMNTRTLRLFFNAVFSFFIFASAIYTGFYPLSLLLFWALFDLRSITTINLPINKSDFIPYNNIEEVKMIKGKLGFNYAHIIILDDAGNKSLKKLKLYDSQSGWNRAVFLFTRIGKLNLIEKPTRSIEGLERITVGNGVEYAIEGDQLLILENGKFNEERVDPFKYFRFVALVGVLGTVSAAAAKVTSIIENYQYYFIDYLVVVFFLFLILIPLRFVRKTKPTILNKSDIKGYLITKRHLIIKLKGWKGFTLIVKHNLKYFSEDGVKTIKQFLEV